MTTVEASIAASPVPRYRPAMSLMGVVTFSLSFGAFTLETILKDLGKFEDEFWLIVLLAATCSGVGLDLYILRKSRFKTHWIMWSIEVLTLSGYICGLYGRETQLAIGFVRVMDSKTLLLIQLWNQVLKALVMNPRWAYALRDLMQRKQAQGSSAPAPEVIVSPENPSRWNPLRRRRS